MGPLERSAASTTKAAAAESATPTEAASASETRAARAGPRSRSKRLVRGVAHRTHRIREIHRVPGVQRRGADVPGRWISQNSLESLRPMFLNSKRHRVRKTFLKRFRRELAESLTIHPSHEFAEALYRDKRAYALKRLCRHVTSEPPHDHDAHKDRDRCHRWRAEELVCP